MERDIFICHASEDKVDVVRPLVRTLEKENITYWVDEGEILWADSITQKVNEGLRISRYVIVILSKSFLEKNWPKRELFAALNLEASSGEIKVLPLLVGDKSLRDDIIKDFPLLNDKRYLTWEGQPQIIVDQVKARLSRAVKESLRTPPPLQTADSGIDIPLPKIRKSFTQRDRDLFLKQSFAVMKVYFQHALVKLQSQYPDVETDFTEIHATKYIAKIYYRGDVKNQCKIWIGGLSASDGIAFSEGRFMIDSDNSFNEIINVEDDGMELKLKLSFNITTQSQNKASLTPTQAAELLWLRFTKTLEYI